MMTRIVTQRFCFQGERVIKMTKRGIWLYGFSGSGKTYASQVIKGLVKNNFVIDGDSVRKFVSKDLGYTLDDRHIQLNRVLGLAQIAISNNVFPIVSTVTMNEDILTHCQKLEIDVVEIIRPLEQLISVRSIYNDQKNVVGKDIHQTPLETHKIENDGTVTFANRVKFHVSK